MWQYDTINGKFIPGTLPAEGNITACYDRLSQEDELEGDSGSVVNQRDFLRKYCEEHHFPNVRHFSDDGYTGTNLLGLDSDTFYIYHVAAVMVDNLRRLLLGINLSDKAIMDFDFPGVGFPV